MRIILGILVVLLLGGCMTQKKREDIAHRYARENPVFIADLSHLYFPVQGKEGETIIIRDTTVKFDTLIIDSTYRIKEIHTIHTNTHRVDTVLDIALVSSLRNDLSALGVKYEANLIEKEIMAQRSLNRLYWLLGLAVLCAILIGVNFVRFRTP